MDSLRTLNRAKGGALLLCFAIQWMMGLGPSSATIHSQGPGSQIEEILISEWCCEAKTMQKGTQITIVASSPFEFREYSTKKPPSLVIQLKAVDLGSYQGRVSVNSARVKEIVPRVTGESDWTSELRFDLRRIVSYRFERADRRLMIRLADLGSAVSETSPESGEKEETTNLPLDAEDSPIRVIRLERERDLGISSEEQPVTDYYLNAGKNRGMKQGMILDVYRSKWIADPYSSEEHEIRILVGQLKIHSVFDRHSVSRIESLETRMALPVLTYSSVMQGDYLHPRTSDGANPSLLSLPSTILFDFDSWALKPEGRRLLDAVAGQLRPTPNHDIVVEGNTCNIGSHEYNKALSVKRANAVAGFLISAIQLPSSRVHIIGHGEAHPAHSNRTEDGRRRNRRVDLRLVPTTQTQSQEHAQEQKSKIQEKPPSG